MRTIGRPRGRRAALAAGALGLLLTTCFAVARHAAAQSTPAPARNQHRASAPAGPGALPLTAYELTPTQDAQVKYLSQRLTQICMQGFGFDYDSSLSTTSVAESVRVDGEFRTREFGVSDPAAVAEYGYHLPPWTAGSVAPTLVADLPSAQLAVLNGTVPTYGPDHKAVPRGGCHTSASVQLAQRGIDPSGTDAAAAVGQIEADTFDQAQKDPRVLAVFGAWSACMRAAGYTFATPFTAAGDPRWAASTASAAEIATAQRDLACKTQVGVAGIETAVWTEDQDAAIGRDTATLAPARSQVLAQASALQAAMAEFGG
jgi:hypothetical protein